MKTIEEEFPPEDHIVFEQDLTAYYTRLRARAVEMEKAQEWRPIDEAPKNGATIQAWDKRNVFAWWGEISRDGRMGWACGGLAHDQAWWYDECHPTHFRPLPPAP